MAKKYVDPFPYEPDGEYLHTQFSLDVENFMHRAHVLRQAYRSEVAKLAQEWKGTLRTADVLEGMAADAATLDMGLVDRVQFGWQSCEASPTGGCIYAADDYSTDYCLICGDPSERK